MARLPEAVTAVWAAHATAARVETLPSERRSTIPQRTPNWPGSDQPLKLLTLIAMFWRTWNFAHVLQGIALVGG